MTPNELASIIDGSGLAPPSATQVAAFEALIGTPLPEDYRQFLLTTPGGRPRGRVVFSLAGEEIGPERVGRVAGLRSDRDYSLEEEFCSAANNDIPLGLLPILTDGGGNTVAIALRQDRFGEVFFLDHEVSGGEGRPSLEEAEGEDWGYAIRFAASFSDMVAGFRQV